ncbi:MAG: hypothetical protein ACI955_002666 [Zhongshania sp.]|jgi:hypothetical protein
MSLRPFADAVALWQPDSHERKLAQARLQKIDRVNTIVTPDGWLLAIRCLPETNIGDVYCEEAQVFMAQGADLFPTDDKSSPFNAIAIKKDLIEATRYCATATTSDFSAAHLGENGTLTVMQSHAALMPIFTAQNKNWLLWSTSLDFAALARPAAPELDDAIAAMVASLASLFAEGRSLIQGIAEEKRGQRIRLKPQKKNCYTNCDDEFLGKPLANAHMDKESCGAALRKIVLDNLKKDLSGKHTNLLSLSGGRDSSTLALLCQDHLKIPITTASLTPSQGDWKSKELDSILALLKDTPAQNKLIIDWPDGSYQANVLNKKPPTAHFVLHPMLCELSFITAKKRVDVYFGGEFCDELIGGEAVLGEWLADLGFFKSHSKLPIKTQTRIVTSRHLIKTYLNTKHRWSNKLLQVKYGDGVPGFIAPDLKNPIRTLLIKGSHFGLSASEQPLHRFHQKYAAVLGMNWAACSIMGIRRSFPLLTRETLTLLRGTHAKHRLAPKSKELFTAAFKSLVPAGILEREGKGFMSVDMPKQTKPPKASPVHRIFDHSAFQSNELPLLMHIANNIADEAQCGVDFLFNKYHN